MGQGGKQLHLAIIGVGSFDDFFRVERVQVDLLNGIAPVPINIPGLVDDTKAALTDLLLDTVALGKYGTWSQGSARTCRNKSRRRAHSRSYSGLYCWSQ